MPHSRFQIEEMLFQDAHGAVFLAMDTESGKEVVLQRFFPFGAGEGGLEGDERVAYDQAIQNMRQLSHPHLRSVMDGGSDPVDGMPFVVMEVRGMSLQQYTGQNALTVAQGRILVESALELMIWLEQRFGQTADWLALHADDVEVAEDGNAYRFCVDPMKWLGLRGGPGAVKELVQLVETALGWTGRVVAGSTAGMLSGWLRVAKTRDLTVAEALILLRDGQIPAPSAAPAPAAAVLAPVGRVISTPAFRSSSAMPIQSTGNARWYLFGLLFCLCVLVLGGFVWKHFQRPDAGTAVVASQKKQTESGRTKSRGIKNDDSSTADEKKLRENAERMARELQANLDSPADLSEGDEDEESKASEKSGEYEPSHVRGIRKQLGKEIFMTQKVTNVRPSSSGKSLYIEFDGEGIAANRACGRYFTNLGVDGMSISELAHLKGKKVRLRGKVVEEFGTGRIMVDLTSPAQIEVMDGK